jgi:hypothetical protein
MAWRVGIRLEEVLGLGAWLEEEDGVDLLVRPVSLVGVGD